MNDTYELRSGDTHIEVHKFFPGAVAGVAIITLILQASFPVYLPNSIFWICPYSSPFILA